MKCQFTGVHQMCEYLWDLKPLNKLMNPENKIKDMSKCNLSNWSLWRQKMKGYLQRELLFKRCYKTWKQRDLENRSWFRQLENQFPDILTGCPERQPIKAVTFPVISASRRATKPPTHDQCIHYGHRTTHLTPTLLQTLCLTLWEKHPWRSNHWYAFFFFCTHSVCQSTVLETAVC